MMQRTIDPGTIIAFSGAQGTGKTIMKNKLVEWIEGHYGWDVLDNTPGTKKSIMRDLCDEGHPINQDATLDSQEYACIKFIEKFYLLKLQMRELQQHNDTIAVVERSMFDSFPYYYRMFKELPYLNTMPMFNIMADMYQIVPQEIIFSRVVAGGDLDNKEYRSISRPFQEEIDRLFDSMYRHLWTDNRVCEIGSLDYDDNLEEIVRFYGL